jgi:hypothetical protein
VDKIVEMTRHTDEKFRETAVWVMQKSGDSRFIPALTELLQEGVIIRARVARALASLKMANA